MPLGDGTGPMGMGPMTGRAAGYCAGYGVPGYMNPMGGRGFGFGRGFGRGFGFGRGWARAGYAPAWGAPPAWGAAPWGAAPYAPPMGEDQETEMLKAQAEWLSGQLETIQGRLAELETEAPQE